jgi:trigger factor
MMEDLRNRFGKTESYGENDFVQMGDTIIVGYKAFINDVLINDLTKDSAIIKVGQYEIKGFDQNILGMKSGETRTFELNMVDGNHAGEVVKFEANILMGSKTVPSPLDDRLAERVGLENFSKLEEAVQSASSSRVKEIAKNYTNDQIARRLISSHEFDVPQWVSTAEAQVNARNNGKDWNVISDEEKLSYIDAAGKSVKLSLILQKVRENEPDAQLSDEEAFKIAAKNIQEHSQEPQKVLEELIKNGHISILLNRVRDEYTLDFIEKTCKIVE